MQKGTLTTEGPEKGRLNNVVSTNDNIFSGSQFIVKSNYVLLIY